MNHTRGAYLFGLFFVILVLIKNIVGYQETDSAGYILVYMIMTIGSSFFALMIAMQAWVYTRIGDSYNNLILAGIFLAIGVFDLLHMLTYPGMPADSYTTTQMSVEYWFIGRVTEMLLLFLLVTQKRATIQLQSVRSASIIISLFYIGSIIILTFILKQTLPADFPIGRYIQVGVILLAAIHLGLVAWLKFGKKNLRLTTLENRFIMPVAIYYVFFYLTLLLGEPGHITYIASHAVKLGALSYLFTLLYIQFGERPYREIERLSATYERFLNTVGEGIFGVDPQGKITFINESACKMLGFRRDELVKRLAHPIIHHTKKNGKPYYIEDSPIYLSLETGEFSFVAEEVFWRKDGTSFPVEYFVQPVFEQGKNTGVLVTFKDVTEPLKLKELEHAHQAVQLEIGLAAKVQNDLFESMERNNLPKNMGVISEAYKELNGDFFTVIPDGDEILFGVADVSGKGIPAAIQMTMMQFAIETRSTPGDTLEQINAFTYTYMEASRFITMFKARYSKDTRILRYASAGHEPGILYNTLTKTFQELMPTGPILGIIDGATWRENVIQLQEGDLLVLFTDGLTERKKNLQDDGEHLHRALSEVDVSLPADQLARELFDRVNQYERLPVEDDQTLLVLKV